MFRLFSFLLPLFLAASVASAQPIPLPQSIGPPAVAVGLDASGNLIPHIVTIGDIATPNPQTTSTTSIFFGGPQIQFALDNPAGFVTGSILFVQVPGLSDNFAYCVATNIDAFGFTTCNITFLQGGMAVYNNFVITLVNGYTTNSVPPWAGQGVDGNTPVSVPTPGTSVSLTIDAGKVFQYSSGAYCYAFSDPQNTWFAGFVTSYNSTSGAISVVTQFVSPTASAQTGFTCSLAPLAQNNASLNNWASDNLTIPSSVPSSLTFTTVVAAQYFPTQGQVLITCTTNTANQMTGQVTAYSGTTMIVNITSVLAGGGTNCSAWAFYLTTGPTTRISLYQMNGLQITQEVSPTSGICVNPGSIRNSQDTIDLVLASQTCIDLASTANVVQAAQVGFTISSSGTTVTCTATCNTDFDNGSSHGNGTLTDINNQLVALGGTGIVAPVLISATTSSPITSAVTNVNSGTSLTTNIAIGAGAGSTAYRGGPISTANTTTLEQIYGILLAYQASTGNIGVFATSFTPSGAPDLPSGYTSYRVIGLVDIFYNSGASRYSISISQVLLFPSPFSGSQFNVLTLNLSPYTGLNQAIYGPVHLDQSAAVINALGAVNGGSGTASPTAHSLLQAEGSSAFGLLTAATAGNIPIDQGSGSDWLSKSLSQDCALAASGAITCTKTNNVAFGALATLGVGTGLTSSGGNLNVTPHSAVPTAVYRATITPTTISGSVSSVNTGTGVITWSTTHGLTTGQSIRGVGTVPTGFTVGQKFYINALSSNTFALYTTLANALADTSRVTLSSTTTGATVVADVATNVFSAGFASISGVAGSPGSTTIGFDFNLSNVLSTTNGAVNFNVGNLFNSTAGSLSSVWAASPDYTFTSTTLIQTINGNFRAITNNSVPGSWANQGTGGSNAFIVMVEIWG